MESQKQFEVARGTPSASRVDLFDSLMTISFLSKALAKEVLLLSTEKNEGGGSHGGKDTFSSRTKQ